ncbi:MAG: putative metal-dependent hydrolase [Herminiimonas sp.]|nr:putative metal-dependent hydrolase [Herminiimonas sp.]
MKKLLRQNTPDPRQLPLQLDLFVGGSASPPLPATDVKAVAASPSPSAPTPSVLAKPPAVRQPGARRIQLGEQVLDYILLRSRRRSIGFVIDDEGLRITAPRWVTLADIDSAIREKQRWIFAKLNERRQRSARRMQPQMQWRDGATLPFLGKEISLRLAAAAGAEQLTEHGIAYDESERQLLIWLPPEAGEQQIRDRVLGWLQSEARRLFAERLPVYAEKLGVRFHSFRLTSAKTQWGSCTADGKIRLNWRLMHFALEQIDYVIAHELAHLREMNHSPRFWATVQSVFPDFDVARKALRDHGPETLPAF